jgi:diadenosine tetraphosphate (Ap4A) HIT family hydrolase
VVNEGLFLNVFKIVILSKNILKKKIVSCFMNKKVLFPDQTVFEGEHFSIEQDWETPIPGFFILGSKRNINSFSEFTDDESTEFMKLLKKVRKVMEEVLDIKEVYFFQNEDSDKKFHLWIFPRHEWMEKFGRKIQSVRPIMDYAEKNLANEEMIEKVKEAVKKIRDYMIN